VVESIKNSSGVALKKESRPRPPARALLSLTNREAIRKSMSAISGGATEEIMGGPS
jgi:hypothetical protein